MKTNRETIFLIILANFLAISQGIEFRCEFGDGNTGSPVGRVYTCLNVQVSDKNNSTSLESIEGVHLTGKTNNDVKALWVYSDATQMQKLPKNIDKSFPNLQVIAWEYGKLTSITADDLRPFSELKHLYLAGNNIVSLGADLFQQTLRLDLVSFSDNQITNVGYDLLKNLNELTDVHFEKNPCIDFWARTPQEIKELKEKLRTQCPPSALTTQSTSTSTTTISTTTTEESCDVRCTLNDEVDELMKNLTDQRSEIEVLKNENAEQRRINDKQSQVINELQRTIINQNVLNAKNEERMLELEQQMQDFLSKPWFFVYKRTLSKKHQ